MVDAAEMFRPTEAAVVAGVALSDVNRAIDRRLIPARLVRRGVMRGVSAEGCVYVAFYYGSAKRLTAEERRLAIETVGKRAESVAARKMWTALVPHCLVIDDFLRIDLTPFLEQTHRRWDRYVAARKMVSSSPETLGGTPVIRGTRIPVHAVASSVAAKLPVERILEAYPSLGRHHLELAHIYAKANPPKGRPQVRLPVEKRSLFDEATLLSEKTVPRRRSKT